MDTTLIAKRIREIRIEKGLTQETLAVRAGLTRSYVSLLENGKKIPAISTLYRVASVLGVKMGDFFDTESESPNIVIIRQADCVPMSNGSFGYAYAFLAIEKKDKIMDPFFVRVSPGKKRTEFVHRGEELMYVTDGKLKLTYGGEEFILEKGDSVYIDSSTAHKLEAVGKRPVFLLSINVKK